MEDSYQDKINLISDGINKAMLPIIRGSKGILLAELMDTYHAYGYALAHDEIIHAHFISIGERSLYSAMIDEQIRSLKRADKIRPLYQQLFILKGEARVIYVTKEILSITLSHKEIWRDWDKLKKGTAEHLALEIYVQINELEFRYNVLSNFFNAFKETWLASHMLQIFRSVLGGLGKLDTGSGLNNVTALMLDREESGGYYFYRLEGLNDGIRNKYKEKILELYKGLYHMIKQWLVNTKLSHSVGVLESQGLNEFFLAYHAYKACLTLFEKKYIDEDDIVDFIEVLIFLLAREYDGEKVFEQFTELVEMKTELTDEEFAERVVKQVKKIPGALNKIVPGVKNKLEESVEQVVSLTHHLVCSGAKISVETTFGDMTAVEETLKNTKEHLVDYSKISKVFLMEALSQKIDNARDTESPK